MTVVLPDEVKSELEKGIKIKARAQALTEEGKMLTKKAREILLPLMVSYEIKKYNMIGVGAVAIRVNKGSSINAVKLKIGLMQQGMPVEEIDKLIKRVSSSWETKFEAFIKPK